MNQTETIEKYYTKIYNLCLYKTKNDKAEAENCTQNIFMILIENWDKLEDRDIYAWLLKTTQHTLMNLYRKKKKESLVQPITSCENIQSDTADPSDLMISDEEIEEHKQKILSQLSPADRDLYRKYFEEKMSYREISEQLGIDYAATQMRVSRLKSRLKKQVSETFCIAGAGTLAIKIFIALIGER